MGNPIKIGVLTKKEYAWLKDQDDLTQEELDKVKQFENTSKSDSLDKPIYERKKITITASLLWYHFKSWYKYVNKKDFIETSDSKKNVGVLLSYFSKDDNFFKSDRLKKEYNKPSFSKSLLIVGFFGNGKTSILRTFYEMFNHYQLPMRFKMVNAHDLVTEWESIEDQGSKHLFFQRYTCKHLCIDDVKKEDKASNYGLKEIVGKIIEKQYDKKNLTILNCNYRETDVIGDYLDAINEFNRYGNHIVDRLYETHNFIEFKGKSFRGR